MKTGAANIFSILSTHQNYASECFFNANLWIRRQVKATEIDSRASTINTKRNMSEARFRCKQLPTYLISSGWIDNNRRSLFVVRGVIKCSCKIFPTYIYTSNGHMSWRAGICDQAFRNKSEAGVSLLTYFLIYNDFASLFVSPNAHKPNTHFRHCNKNVFLEWLEITNTPLLKEKIFGSKFSVSHLLPLQQFRNVIK